MEIPFHIGNLSNIKDLILRHVRLENREQKNEQKATEAKKRDREKKTF